MHLHTSTAPAVSRAERKRTRPGPWRRAGLLALAALITALALAAQANAAGTTLNVSGSSGADTNPGSVTAPLKTLTKALKLAHAGDSIKLAGGVYGQIGSAGNGEQFPAGGLLVPSGVTITGATSGGFPSATLLGSGTGAGLNLAGDATVRNLTFGGNGFGVSVFAKTGKQTLSNLVLTTAKGSAVIDGSPATAAILLRGTAQASLNAGAAQSITGVAMSVNANTGVAVQQQARFAMHGVQITLADGANGVVTTDQAHFTMDGGKITGGAANCGIDATAISLRDAAQATLQNGAKLENIPGFGIFIDRTAKAALNGATITRDNPAGCQGRPSVDAHGSAALTTNNATIAASGGQEINGITTGGTVTLALKGTVVHGFSGNGIDLSGNETLTMDGGSVSDNVVGINAKAADTPHIKITGAAVIRNTTGIQVTEPILKLRSSKVSLNQTGIAVRGEVGGLPVGDTCVFACVNLGTQDDPGNNNLAGNTVTGVDNQHLVGSSNQSLSDVTAVGNIWNGNTQGASGDGRYLTPLVVNIGDPLAVGRNFELSGASTLIELAGSTVGRLHLTPHVVPARADKLAHLTMSWTHPHSWRQLKTIQLRAFLGAKIVGTVTLTARDGHLSSSGATAVLAGKSRVTRRGKTVTARLALRLSSSLAGSQLRLAVQATDRHGHSQLQAAGVIRVAR